MDRTSDRGVLQNQEAMQGIGEQWYEPQNSLRPLVDLKNKKQEFAHFSMCVGS